MINNDRNYLTGCGIGMMVSAVIVWMFVYIIVVLAGNNDSIAAQVFVAIMPFAISISGIVIGGIGLRGKDNE